MTDRRFTRHPLSSLCGDMDAESFNALVNDIREQGQLEPIDLVGDKIVDGWHRYRACEILELEPKTRTLAEGLELVEYVLGKNAHRRHMTAEQRAAVVLLAAEWMPSHRPAATGKGDTVSPLSNEAAAVQAGVSKRTIQRVKAQIRAGHGEALAKGSETLRSLAAKERRAATTGARKSSGKAVEEKRQERSRVSELRSQVAFLKTEIEKRDARIAELVEEVERLTMERDELVVGDGWG
ncbi:MAG: ParB/RepB/Spo0J family partition protein [Gemmatimonadota bacterium]|nr:ParB/RepB/Spo0J family partition protein [Gemmatimonadota bacterium]MDE2871020.1 ParB/RepB/Spo0J family partition protein [Gemmatimonadota bacterium]